MSDWSKYHEAIQREPINQLEPMGITNSTIRATFRTFAQEVRERAMKEAESEGGLYEEDWYYSAFTEILKEKGIE